MPATIISVINHKGGVGKTTTTINISAGLALLGKKVLAVDLDTQMNLTHSLIGELEENEPNIADTILNEKVSLKDIVRETQVKNLYLAPSGESMVNLDLKLHSAPVRREFKLKDALKANVDEYDFVVIDNPPHISFTIVNSLIASHCYIVPVSAEYLPLVGIRHLIKTIDEIRPSNLSIHNLGYLLTMVDRRESISGDVEKILRDSFQEEVFKNVIRINTKLKACPQKKQTIFQTEPQKGKGHTDYLNVTKEILKRLENA